MQRWNHVLNSEEKKDMILKLGLRWSKACLVVRLGTSRAEEHSCASYESLVLCLRKEVDAEQVGNMRLGWGR